MQKILIYGATFLPIILYLIIGLRRSSRPNDLADYFIYGRSVSASDFANTTIGYAMQMAALFLFIDWGIRYGFGAFWVPVFWAIGYAFLYIALPRLHTFLGRDWTIHGFLDDRYNSRCLRWVAAVATLIGLWGTMMVEIDYTAAIYASLFSSTASTIAIGSAFLIFSLVYITYGGYKAEVNTSRLQVPVAYSCLLLVILTLIAQISTNGYVMEFRIMLSIFVFLNVGLICAKVFSHKGNPWSDKQIFIPIAALVLAAFTFIFSSNANLVSAQISQVSLLTDIPSQLKAQGLIALISLFISNALWQFVDVSSWQRISSVTVDKATDSPLPHIRKGLLRVMIESPISWGFGVIMGISLRYAGYLTPAEDASVAISNFSKSLFEGSAHFDLLGPLSPIILPLFLAAVVAIMLSTVNALISSITFVAFKDLTSAKSKAPLRTARWLTLGIVVSGAVFYYCLRYVTSLNIGAILYTFYACQIALAPTVVGAILQKRKNYLYAPAAILSISAGIAFTFIAAVYLDRFHPDYYYLVPPLVALVIATVVFIWVQLLQRKREIV